jgi:hypothetical protein
VRLQQQRRRLLEVAILALAPLRASADEAHRLAALAPADDARRAVAVGPAGQLYEPDGKGAWIRHRPGGVGTDVATAARVGTGYIVGTNYGAFRFANDTWSVIDLGLHAKPITALGARAVAAVGRRVFVLDRGAPAHVVDVATPITAIGAADGIVVATDRGVFRIDGKAIQPIPRAPSGVVALVGDRWALVGHGAVDLGTGAATTWPDGLAIGTAAQAPDGALVAAATAGDAAELVTIRGGKLERDKLPMDRATPPVGITADREGRVVIALSDGRVCLRERGAWTVTMVTDELPADHPGSPPATSR